MNSWVPTALAVALVTVSSVAPADAGSCAHSKSHNCLQLPAAIDFSSVPDISNQIVGGEAATRSSPPDLAAPPSASPYTGPMVGISTKARAPTVGYYWSIN